MNVFNRTAGSIYISKRDGGDAGAREVHMGYTQIGLRLVWNNNCVDRW